jgi:transposase-like protein
MLGVEAGEIGSSGEIKTIVDIGKKYERMQVRYKLLSKLAAMTTETEKNRELVFQFVRDNLDDTGTLSIKNEEMLAVMKLKTMELNTTYTATQAEIEKLDNLQIEYKDTYIKADVIYPNTIVRFGVGEQLIREPLRRIKLTPLEKGATVTLEQETVDS